MFDIKLSDNNVVYLSGRFDAAQVDRARSVFDTLSTSTTVDFKDLQYISSAGLGVLLATQKRLHESGNGLKLINLDKHIWDVFHYAGFDQIFEIH